MIHALSKLLFFSCALSFPHQDVAPFPKSLKIQREFSLHSAVLSLRGGQDRRIAEMISSETEDSSTSSFSDIEWKAVPKIPGYEDAPPHASEHNWDPSYYIENGIDITGGFFNGIDTSNWTQKLNGLKLENFSFTREMNRLRQERMIEEREFNSELSNHTIPSANKDYEPRPKNYVQMPIRNISLDDWANMTETEISARLSKAVDQFLNRESSALFNPEFVYGADHNTSEKNEECDEEARKRFMFSTIGMEGDYLAIKAMQEDNKDRLRPVDRSLVTAAQDGDAQQVGFWLRRGADKDVRDCFWMKLTPLQHAALLGHVAVIRMLLDNGADVHLAEPVEGRTALHIAAARGNTAAARLLVQRGAVIDSESLRGRTPLHDAASMGPNPNPVPHVLL